MKAILDALRAGPLTRSALAKAVGGRRKVALDAIRSMLEAGALVAVDGRLALPPPLPKSYERIPPPPAEHVQTDMPRAEEFARHGGPALFEVIDPTAYLRFPGKPPDHVRAWLLERKWYFRVKTTVWNAPAYDWPEARAFLEGEGYALRADTLDVPRPARRQAEGAAHAAAIAAAPADLAAQGFAGFDWSGFPAWSEAHLLIEDRESGVLIPFRLNESQARFFAACWDQWVRTGRIRQVIVKRRQRGISTLILALMYYVALHVPNIEALVMSHEIESADFIFRRAKVFLEGASAALGAPARNNKRELQFPTPHRSAIRILVPSDRVGRGGTRRLVHASELPQWGSCAHHALTSILNSVPDARGTAVFIEATAKGVGNAFEERYTAAKKGHSDYEAHFCDWKGHADCSLAVPLDHPRFDNIPIEWSEDEPRLRALGYADDQLAWRRVAIPDKCESDPAIFCQEYPATDLEAFRSSGSNVFPLSVVDVELEATTAIERRTPAPRFRIDFDFDEPAEADGDAKRLVADSRGQFRVWKQPVKGEPYIVAGDVARGENVSGETGDPTKLDYTTYRVISEWPDADGKHEEVAVWHGRMDPDRAAFWMAWIGRYYNNALLIPEVNGAWGMLLVGCLLKLHSYPRVFRRESIDRPTRNPVPQESDRAYLDYGWLTGGQIAKARMVAYLYAMIRDRLLTIHDPMAWSEMRTYIRAADATTDAESGKHDDIVMAESIGASYLTLHPKLRPIPKAIIQPPKVVGSEEETRVEVDPEYFREKLKERKKREHRGWTEDFT